MDRRDNSRGIYHYPHPKPLRFRRQCDGGNRNFRHNVPSSSTYSPPLSRPVPYLVIPLHPCIPQVYAHPSYSPLPYQHPLRINPHHLVYSHGPDYYSPPHNPSPAYSPPGHFDPYHFDRMVAYRRGPDLPQYDPYNGDAQVRDSYGHNDYCSPSGNYRHEWELKANTRMRQPRTFRDQPQDCYGNMEYRQERQNSALILPNDPGFDRPQEPTQRSSFCFPQSEFVRSQSYRFDRFSQAPVWKHPTTHEIAQNSATNGKSAGSGRPRTPVLFEPTGSYARRLEELNSSLPKLDSSYSDGNRPHKSDPNSPERQEHQETQREQSTHSTLCTEVDLQGVVRDVQTVRNPPMKSSSANERGALEDSIVGKKRTCDSIVGTPRIREAALGQEVTNNAAQRFYNSNDHVDVNHQGSPKRRRTGKTDSTVSSPSGSICATSPPRPGDE